MSVKVAIIGSGNIGTDLMIKVLRTSGQLEMAALVGIDPASDGLARAKRLGIPTTADGVDGLVQMPGFDDIAIVFDATSAGAHARHNAVLRAHAKQIVDLTPAAIGPYLVPAVNMHELTDQPNVNLVTCGGQATIPIVAAITRVAPAPYAEIVASIASRSAGPGTRANIDEFTRTTARGLERVGGARKGKAIIVLNPAEPPLIMRNTVFCLVEHGDTAAIERSVEQMAADVRAYVPGYHLKQAVQFEEVTASRPVRLDNVLITRGIKVSVFLEIEGAGHYLPKYAGNLDIMTSAALRTGERLAGSHAARPVMA
ncbi:MAG TPA: acetaldehyde dehydrogenase (acetylating) [Vicinamibacterales bacterium]|nr:acetaldehyde dehydrogenase (acetylating) [Vicinamibacterales bacterium]